MPRVVMTCIRVPATSTITSRYAEVVGGIGRCGEIWGDMTCIRVSAESTITSTYVIARAW